MIIFIFIQPTWISAFVSYLQILWYSRTRISIICTTCCCYTKGLSLVIESHMSCSINGTVGIACVSWLAVVWRLSTIKCADNVDYQSVWTGEKSRISVTQSLLNKDRNIETKSEFSITNIKLIFCRITNGLRRVVLEPKAF